MHISPDAVRPWEKKKFKRQVLSTKTPPRKNLHFFDLLDAEITTGTIRVVHPFVPRDYYDPSNYRITNISQIKKRENAPLKLKGIGMAYPEMPKPDEKNSKFLEKEIEFYSPRGEKISGKSPGKVLPEETDRTFRVYDFQPWIWFYLDFTGSASPSIIDSKIFDFRTHAFLTPGSSSRYRIGKTDTYSIGHELKIYHSSSFLFTIDYVSEFPETRVINAVNGTEAQFSDTKLLLIAAARGSGNNVNSFISSKNMEVNISNEDSGKRKTSLIFALEPGTEQEQFKIEALTRTGKRETEMFPGLSADFVFIRTLYTPLNEIKGIRISYNPKIERVLIPLENPPGFPKENENPDDLRNVKIPYAEFDRGVEMRTFLENVLEMEITGPGVDHTVSHRFPLEYENVHAGEILEDYIELHHNHQVDLDANNWKMVVSEKKDLKTRLKDFGCKYLPFLF